MKKLFTAILLTATMFALNASVTPATDIGIHATKEVPKTETTAKFDIKDFTCSAGLSAVKVLVKNPCAEVAIMPVSAIANGEKNLPLKFDACLSTVDVVVDDPCAEVAVIPISAINNTKGILHLKFDAPKDNPAMHEPYFTVRHMKHSYKQSIVNYRGDRHKNLTLLGKLGVTEHTKWLIPDSKRC